MKMSDTPVRSSKFRFALACAGTLVATLSITACSATPPRQEMAVDNSAAEPVELNQAPLQQQAAAKQNTIRVKASSPRQYTVKKGDTLWDISSLFLQDPWYWPEIWNRNPQVENPHLIYPGDVLTLVYIGGRPQILVNQVKTSASPAGMRTVKLSPSIRRNALDASITSIPGDAIRQFITKPRVVTKEELDSAPYILGSDDKHLILGEGNRIYVRGELDKERVRYTVFRPGKKLIDPDTDALLGYEAVYAGEAHIDKYGDPATGYLTRTEREVLIGDRLLPTDKSKINNLYFPKIPDRKLSGKVISLFDGLFGIAKFQVAVMNLGDRDGIEIGHLLASYTRGDTVYDRFAPVSAGDIKLPNERSGLIMIFRTFKQVSYGLVLESTDVIHQNDVVSTPQ
jgi:nucleoid-associated protein YgaU